MKQKNWRKKILSIGLIAIVLSTSLMPRVTKAEEITLDEKIATAFYEESRNMGYTWEIDLPDSTTFMDVMNPVVNAIKSAYTNTEDAFYTIEGQLVYGTQVVRAWVNYIFGDKSTGFFDTNNKIHIDKALYNSTLARIGQDYINYGYNNNYPLLLNAYTLTNMNIIPIFAPSYNNGYTETKALTLFVESYINEGSYTFNGILKNRSKNKCEFSIDGESFIDFSPSKAGNLFCYKYGGTTYETYGDGTPLYTKRIEAENIALAFQEYLAYIKSNIVNYTIRVYYNGNYYYVSPAGYKVVLGERPIENDKEQRPINIQYIYNDWGDATTIYYNTIINPPSDPSEPDKPSGNDPYSPEWEGNYPINKPSFGAIEIPISGGAITSNAAIGNSSGFIAFVLSCVPTQVMVMIWGLIVIAISIGILKGLLG